MMNTEIEAELIDALSANLEAAERACAARDMVALAALAEQEARYMDALRALWSQRADTVG